MTELQEDNFFQGVNISKLTSKDIVIIFKQVLGKFTFEKGYVDTTNLQLEALKRFMQDLGYLVVDNKMHLGFCNELSLYNEKVSFNDAVAIFNRTQTFISNKGYTVNGKNFAGVTYYSINGDTVNFKSSDLINAYSNQILDVVSLQYQKSRKGRKKGFKVTKPQIKFREFWKQPVESFEFGHIIEMDTKNFTHLIGSA